MYENLLSSAMPSVAQYAGNTALDTALGGVMANIPSFAGSMATNFSPELLATLGTGAADSGLQNGIFQFLNGAGATGGGMFDSITSALGSDAFKNLTSAGTGLFGAVNSYNSAKDATKLAKENQAMYRDAYNRDVAADEKRQLLNF